jgi:hypothetical protein
MGDDARLPAHVLMKPESTYRLPCDVMLPGDSLVVKGTPLGELITVLAGRFELGDALNRFNEPDAPKVKAPPQIELMVVANDYSYRGHLVGVAFKRSGVFRYVVEDDNGRLFVHSAVHIGKEEGWLP